MKGFVFALCLFLPSMCLAQALTAVDVSNLAEGQSIVITKKNGVITSRPLVLITPSDQPTVPPPPTGDLTPFEKEIAAQTKAVLNNQGTKTTGAALSEVYSHVSSGVADGSIDHKQSLAAIKAGTNLVLAEMPDAALWAPWRLAIGEALDKLQQEGSLSTQAQFSSVFKSVSKGLNSATGYTPTAQTAVKKGEVGKGILDGIDIAKIIELIKLIMELMKLFKP